VLRVNSIDVYYGNVIVLKNVLFRVNEGELLAFIGANGAGKSTTLKTISGLIRPRKGSITFLGEEIAGLAPHKIVKLGISHCPERRRLFPQMSVSENLEMGAYLYKGEKIRKRECIDKIFQQFPILKDRRNQAAGTLSGGEQQMLAIGRAIMLKPKLFLLDEPSLGLAPVLVDRIFNIIASIKKEGTTILLVEQNANIALEICDRAYVLETGKICAEGKGYDLLRDEHVKSAYLGT
jgi:branched-chain amino acid transport system ATP-binding protein